MGGTVFRCGAGYAGVMLAESIFEVLANPIYVWGILHPQRWLLPGKSHLSDCRHLLRGLTVVFVFGWGVCLLL